MTSDESFQAASSSKGMSSNTRFSNSTPFETNSRSGPRLSTTNERAFVDDLEKDPHFIENLFVPLDTIPDLEDGSIMQSIRAISSAGKEVDVYDDVVDVFNKIAQSVGTIGHNPPLRPLHFLSSHTKIPSAKNPQQTRRIAPDILVLPPLPVSKPFLQSMNSESKDRNSPCNSFRCPWSILESIVEVKPKKEWKIRQSVDYLQTILQHRPDKVSVLGITCNQTGYRFYYLDACTQKISDPFQWDDGLKRLIHYIYSLHQIYVQDIGRDTSIQLHNIVWKDKYNSSIWQISFKGENYRIQPIFERRGSGRRTWIAVGTATADHNADDIKNGTSAVRVVKDMWRDNSRRYIEANLLRRIHENGFVPGVVRPVSDSDFNHLTAGNRTKHRLVMGSTGLRLSACKSALDFFKVIYDAIEAHEKVVEQGVLHRDISWYNVLCKPQHYIGNDNVINHPNIGKVLGEPNSQSLCLLTDFDNAALIQDHKDPNEGTQRTGTPMFMACELAYEEYGYDILRISEPRPPITLSQLSLEDEALEKYTQAYGRGRYDEFDERISSVLSGLAKEVDPFADGNLVPPHRPHHDVESIYWIIVWFIMKAWPTDTVPYAGVHSVGQRNVLQLVHSRMIPYHMPDGPLCIVTRSYGLWKLALHPSFHCLAQMLTDMGDYIRMCWSRFPDMPYWHSHEAFKRLLLKEIIRMTNEDTPIPIQGPRPPIPKPFQTYPDGTTLEPDGYPTTQSPTRSGSRSEAVESTNPKQSGKINKRARSSSTSVNSGTATKKQRSSVLRGHAANAPPDAVDNHSDFAHIYLENIEDDDKLWFTL